MTGLCARALGAICFAAAYFTGLFTDVPSLERLGRGMAALVLGLAVGACIGASLERLVLGSWAGNRKEETRDEDS